MAGPAIDLPAGFAPEEPDPLAGQSLASPKGAVLKTTPLDPTASTFQSAPGYHLPPGFTPEGTTSLWDWASRKGSDLVGAVEGQRQYDLPHLVPALNQQLLDQKTPDQGFEDPRRRVVRSVLFAPDDPDAQVSAIRQNFPSARFTQDTYGNLIVNLDGQRYYANPSGLTTTDIDSMAAQGLMFGPGIRGLGAAGKAAAGALGRIVGVGAGFGGANIASQALSHEAGSQAPLRMGDVGSATVAGMGFEGAGGAVARGIGSLTSLLRNPSYFDAMAGTWTPEGRAVMARIGVDPDTVTPAMAMKFASIARGTTEAQGAARQAVAGGMPTPVPLTTGQSTQDINAIRREGMAREGMIPGTAGEQAQRVGLSQVAAQNAALQGNVRGIQGVIAGGAPAVDRPGLGAQKAQADLITQKTALGQDVDTAYDAARAASRTGYSVPAYPPEAIGTLQKRMAPILQDYDETTYPAVHKAVSSLDDLTQGGTVPATVEEMETWRRQRLNDASARPEQAGAIKKIVSVYDAELNGALKEDLMSGDPAVIDKWRGARALRSRYGQLFGQDDVVNELTSTMDDGSKRLVVDPPNAVNYIFGRGQLGANDGLRRDLLKLKSTLGENSDGWNAIREEGWLKLAGNQDPSQSFNSGLYNRNLRKAFAENPEAMNTLYTPAEQDLFKQFGRVADWTTRMPTTGQKINPSNTAVIDNIAKRFGPVGNLAVGWAKRILTPGGPGGAQAKEAISSLTGQLPGRALPGAPSYAAPLAGAASQPPPAQDLMQYVPGMPH